MKPITITLGSTEHGSRTFDVEQDGKVCDGLCWDEMLGQIIALTFPTFRVQPGGEMYPMKTPEEWKAYRARRFRGEAEPTQPSSSDDVVF
ncbi:hypothetical protein AB4Z40_08605 [Bosea sp. 2YAB26]|uniref:hypothetical protein n=1 Tax=Bosea sp. 2YAB26 TaxID=3237478 RepID=UPI003F8F5F99